MEAEKKALIIIALCIIVLGMFYACSADSSSTVYNHGIHYDCGGKLIYQQAVGHKYSTSYIFKCDKCNELLEFESGAVDYDTIYYEDGSTKPSVTYETEEEYSDELMSTQQSWQ